MEFSECPRLFAANRRSSVDAVDSDNLRLEESIRAETDAQVQPSADVTLAGSLPVSGQPCQLPLLVVLPPVERRASVEVPDDLPCP
jgi:hypothetical protein